MQLPSDSPEIVDSKRKARDYSFRRRARGYEDHDFVRARPRLLDYDDLESSPRNDFSLDSTNHFSKNSYKNVADHHVRGNPQDGHHLIPPEPKNSSTNIDDSTFRPPQNLRQDDRDNLKDLQESQNKRQKTLHRNQARVRPGKKVGSRSNRLCVQCGNYHSTPCHVPVCSRCETKHPTALSCLEGMQQLKKRLEIRSVRDPFSTAKKRLGRTRPAISGLRAPSSLLKSANQALSLGNPADHPLCRECGDYHNPPCTLLQCVSCLNKHHPEITCTVAEARLKRRLEGEDEKQDQKEAQRRQAEEDHREAEEMFAMRTKLAESAQKQKSPVQDPGTADGLLSEPAVVKTATLSIPSIPQQPTIDRISADSASDAPIDLVSNTERADGSDLVEAGSSWFVDSNGILQYRSASQGLVDTLFTSDGARFLEQNVDELIAEYSNQAMASGHNEDSHDPPSYLEYMRRRGAE